MMNILCPLHGFRDLGRLRWLPPGLPLQVDDKKFCMCPPSPLREFLQGQRGPLNEEEQREQERMWEQAWSAQGIEQHRREDADVQRLLRRYALQKKMRGGDHGKSLSG